MIIDFNTLYLFDDFTYVAYIMYKQKKNERGLARTITVTNPSIASYHI